ncbi:MAG: hypothetical protein WCD67_10170, partial [Xanthobacteraceae bacterium]
VSPPRPESKTSMEGGERILGVGQREFECAIARPGLTGAALSRTEPLARWMPLCSSLSPMAKLETEILKDQ